MSIFPFVEPTEEVIPETLPIPKEWAWDYENNDFLFKNKKPYLVEGLEAIKVWVYKALKTERFKHDFYSWDYGSEIASLIGSGFTRAAVELEVQRLVWEALQSNPYIISVSGFVLEFDSDSLSVEFTLETIFGEAEVRANAI